LIIELKKAGLDTESEKPISVYYDNEIVGEFIADIIVSVHPRMDKYLILGHKMPKKSHFKVVLFP